MNALTVLSRINRSNTTQIILTTSMTPLKIFMSQVICRSIPSHPNIENTKITLGMAITMVVSLFGFSGPPSARSRDWVKSLDESSILYLISLN